MDSSQADYDMLDLLAWNCNQLSNQLIDKTDDEQETIIDEYIKRVDNEFETIKDFQEDLDWFNVTEPLSFRDTLQGKIVVLDFFTYCCINCMHILPDLKRLENLYTKDGLVVVGVHSAKFDNEKESVNILSAVQRYEITHPVVNDSQSSMWMDLHIKCWPTLLILGPRGNPLFVFMGEGHSKTLEKYVGGSIKFYRSSGALENHTVPMSTSADLIITSNLKFPGKMACSKQFIDASSEEILDDSSKELYAISDSGNHRILLIEPDGKVVEKIGGKTSGFVDGNFEKARFNSPQGVTFYKKDIIYVADTENHAIRQIDLANKTVITIGGQGKQGVDQVGGLIGSAQEISSPWDVATYRTRDMDMSFHMDEESIPERDVILIAMAGTHQIWAIFTEETIWWKFKKFPAGALAAIAGNGHEENRNNSYPQNSAFAQPSGLAISGKHKELYIADSESSCIRKLSLAEGKVFAVAGGDRNPLNLFAFGDVDGVQLVAKLQHPLGVAYNAKDHVLFVADTYNHKIKTIDLSTNECKTCVIKNAVGNVTEFNEPGGMCLSPNCDLLYVCDTNNHTIECVNLEKMTSQTLKLLFNTTAQRIDLGNQIKLPVTFKIQPTGAKILLNFTLKPEPGVKFTDDAPQKWSVQLPNDLWKVPNEAGSLQIVNISSNDEPPQISVQSNLIIDIAAPSIRNSQEHETLLIIFKLNLCTIENMACFSKTFTVNLPIIYSLDGMNSIDENIEVTISEKEVQI